MCGFIGVLRPRTAGPVREDELRALLPSLRHRGPDQEGVFVRAGYGVAAARLRIRGAAEGDQPVVSRSGRRAVVFNGELLYEGAAAAVGPGTCDTPALLELDEQAGEGVGALLAGNMGALVRFDARARRVELARDALGIKPLYVAELEDGSVWFASEITPLLRVAPALRRADHDGLAELLHYHRPRARLPFAGVRDLPRGVTTVLRLDKDGYLDGSLEGGADALSTSATPTGAGSLGTGSLGTGSMGTGSLGMGPAAPLLESDPPAAVRRAWRESAERSAAVDGPVSLFLSGGLDSSAVAAWAGREDMLCLTGRFGPEGGDFDESEAAAAVATHCGLRHEIVDLRDEDLIADLPDVVRALEMPIAGPGSLALWRMAKRAHQHGRVVLTGTGGDEIFGGYARVALVMGRAGAWTRGYEPLRARIEAAGTEPAARMRAAFDRSEDLQRVLAPSFRSSLGWPVTAPLLSDRSPLRSMLWEERNGTLRSLLHVEDRVMMAHGLEGRPVGCLGSLPAVAAALPDAWLVGPDGEGKRALRAALAGAIPEQVRTDTRKRGFPTPFARAARGAGRARVEAWLHEKRFEERGWWDVEAVRGLLDEERPDYDRALFAVLSWEWWARLFLDGDAFATSRTDAGTDTGTGVDTDTGTESTR